MTLLYILYSPVHKAIKIGISDVSGRRFASHRQKGWILIKYWWFSERDQARSVESLVLDTLRTKYGHFLSKADMPQGGYTETFDASKITRRGLVRMVNNAITKSLEFGAKERFTNLPMPYTGNIGYYPKNAGNRKMSS